MSRRILIGLVAATSAGVGMGSDAFAAGASLYTEGLHISSGALIDPSGRAWVADHNAGFCRVTEPTASSPGHIENPQFPGDTGNGAPTCLGGLLPEAGTGPDAAQTATFFDRTPGDPGSGDEYAFIPDGSAPSQDVVRAKWNPITEKFEFDGTVAMDADVDPDSGDVISRPNAASLGPDGLIYVTFQKSGTIQRFDPDDDTPTAEIVGRTSDGRGALYIAVGGTPSSPVVYVAEAAGIRQFTPNPSNPPQGGASFAMPAGDTVNALAYDPVDDFLYAGTANGPGCDCPTPPPAEVGADKVHRFAAPGASGPTELNYATGFSMIGGMAVRPDGNLFVQDDVGLLANEPIGTGKMYLVGLPVAHIGSGPTNAAGAQAEDPAFTNDPTPTFGVTGDPDLQCAVFPAGGSPSWEACAGGSFTPAAPLADGDWVFSTRSVSGAGEGVPESHAFTVDTVAPGVPSIDSPANGATVSGSPEFVFSSEPAARFACSLDGAGFTDCAPGRTFTFGSDGGHTLAITARDRAGNVSAPSPQTAFTVDTAAPTTTIASPADGATTGSSPSFEFSASEAGSTFECRLDGGAFAPCGSPHGYAGVADGAHTFQVRATDAVGSVGPVASRTFTVGSGPRVADPDGPRFTVGDDGRVVDSATGRPLALAGFRIRRKVGLRQVRRSGLRFQVVLPEGAETVRVTLYRLTRGGRAQAAGRELVTQFFRFPSHAGRYTVTMRGRKLRRTLRTGAYRIEITPGTGRTRLGQPSVRSFRIVR